MWTLWSGVHCGRGIGGGVPRRRTQKVAKDDDDRQENCLLFLAEGLLFEGIVN